MNMTLNKLKVNIHNTSLFFRKKGVSPRFGRIVEPNGTLEYMPNGVKCEISFYKPKKPTTHILLFGEQNYLEKLLLLYEKII